MPSSFAFITGLGDSDNPFVFSSTTNLQVRSITKKKKAPAKGRIIYKGPPSEIKQHTRGEGASAVASSSAATPVASSSAARSPTLSESECVPCRTRAGTKRTRRRTQLDEDTQAFIVRHPVLAVEISSAAPSSATRVRPKRTGQPGWHHPREEEMTVESLLLNGVAPPAMTTSRDHQSCDICLGIKSHPVSYAYGHSHCYKCIRVWLETHWTCPYCRAIMHSPPFRNYDAETGLALDHPDFHDESVVDYSFEGLRFPKPRILDHSW
ncbi:hypothetical protein DFH09DRAFT_1095590 [Mycena vulgaris]|nr:hypothetical protein DFH09DRAFT_1095590 [Mycena vulgaris]